MSFQDSHILVARSQSLGLGMPYFRTYVHPCCQTSAIALKQGTRRESFFEERVEIWPIPLPT